MGKKNFRDLTAYAENGKVYFCFRQKRNGENEEFSPLQIYRRSEKEYVFGEDYEEYFNEIPFAYATLIFEGALLQNNSKTVFCDTEVDLDTIYQYWVKHADEADIPAGPAVVKVRDPRVMWSYDKINDVIQKLSEDFPTVVETMRLGSTVSGRDMMAVVVGNRANLLLCTGAIHASESGPEILLIALRNIIENNLDILLQAGLCIIPIVNIDERERFVKGTPWYLRVNQNGVDLNRNFDANWQEIDYSYHQSSDDPRSSTYRGAKPNSEPETLALMHAVDSFQPKVIFNYHSLTSITEEYMLVSAFGVEDQAYMMRCQTIAEAYQVGYRHDVSPEIEIKEGQLFPICTVGSFPSWAYLKYGIPSYDLESDWSGDRHENEKASSDHTTYEMLLRNVQRHEAGLVRILKLLSAEQGDVTGGMRGR